MSDTHLPLWPATSLPGAMAIDVFHYSMPRRISRGC
jgi:hypothetical protein